MEEELEIRVGNWIREILADQHLEELELKFPNCDTGGGSIADLVFVEVTGVQNGTKRTLDLIIKKSKDSDIVQDTLNLKHAYSNEVNMYSTFVPYLQKFAEERNSNAFENIPHCYGTKIRECEYVIILDNLKAKGFKVRELDIPHDLDHTKLVVEAYAKWHAFGLALSDQKPHIFDEFRRSCKGYLDVGTKMFQYVVATVEKELEAVSKIYIERNESQIAEKLNSLKEKYKNLLGDCMLNKQEDYLIIRHGDCWNNNYLFHYDKMKQNPDRVAIIDWQFGVFGSPVTDLTSYLFSCCSITEIDHLDEILMFYYDTLSNKLRELDSDPEKCFPWDICVKSFNRYAPIGIAGMPMFVKVSCTVKSNKSYDIAQATEKEDFSNIFEGKLRDPEDYFKKIDGILKFCMKRNFI